MSRRKPPLSKTLSEIARRRGWPSRIADRAVALDHTTGRLITLDELREQSERRSIWQLRLLIELVQPRTRKPSLSKRTVQDLESLAFGFVDMNTFPKRPTSAEIRKFLGEIGESIRRLFASDNHETWEINLMARSLAIRVAWEGGPHVRYLATDWADAVRLGVARLLEGYGHLIKSCARISCGRIFLSALSRNRYCTPGCSLKERQARFRTRPPEELTQKRREAYWRHLKKTKGKAIALRAEENYRERSQKNNGDL